MGRVKSCFFHSHTNARCYSGKFPQMRNYFSCYIFIYSSFTKSAALFFFLLILASFINSQINSVIPGDFRSMVYYYGIQSSGVETWDKLFKTFRNNKIASEKNKLLYGLAAIQEPWALERWSLFSFPINSLMGACIWKCLPQISCQPSLIVKAETLA